MCMESSQKLWTFRILRELYQFANMVYTMVLYGTASAWLQASK